MTDKEVQETKDTNREVVLYRKLGIDQQSTFRVIRWLDNAQQWYLEISRPWGDWKLGDVLVCHAHEIFPVPNDKWTRFHER